MSKAAQGPSGTNSSPSGASESENTETTTNVSVSTTEANEPGTVSVETYRKTLNQEKNLRERLNALESEKKQSQEADLRAKEDYKKLLETRDAELTTERDSHRKLQDRINTGTKIRSVLDGVNGTIDREYWDLIPVGTVVLDPETGMPDPATVREAVRILETKFSKIISPKSVKVPPSDAAKGSASLDLKAQMANAKTQAELEQILKRNGKQLA